MEKYFLIAGLDRDMIPVVGMNRKESIHLLQRTRKTRRLRRIVNLKENK